MSDDSETEEDTKKGSRTELNDDSCTLEYIEIVPLDRLSDDYHTSEFIYPVVEVKPEDLQEMKEEPADEDDIGDSHYYVKQEPADAYDTGCPSFPVQVSSMLSFSFIYVKQCCPTDNPANLARKCPYVGITIQAFQCFQYPAIFRNWLKLLDFNFIGQLCIPWCIRCICHDW